MTRTTKESDIRGGKWNTLETRWGTAEIKFYFRTPRGAKIRVRYGIGWFSKSRQEQVLDGQSEKTLGIGGVWGLSRAKVQIRPERDTPVVFDFEAVGP